MVKKQPIVLDNHHVAYSAMSFVPNQDLRRFDPEKIKREKIFEELLEKLYPPGYFTDRYSGNLPDRLNDEVVNLEPDDNVIQNEIEPFMKAGFLPYLYSPSRIFDNVFEFRECDDILDIFTYSYSISDMVKLVTNDIRSNSSGRLVAIYYNHSEFRIIGNLHVQYIAYHPRDKDNRLFRNIWVDVYK